MKHAPPIHPIEQVILPQPEVIDLPNGSCLYVTHADVQPVIKLEVIIEAGRWQEHQPCVAQATNAIWRDGSHSRTGADAAERIDFYGATLQGYHSLDHAGFTLYALEKYLPQVLPIVFDLLVNPAFPSDELDTFINRAIAQLRINAGKADVQGYRLLTESLFGKQHPYGYNSTEAALRNLSKADIQRHHAKHYLAGNVIAFVSGRVSTETITLITDQLNQLPGGDTRPQDKVMLPLSTKRLHHCLKNAEHLQSALRMGRTFGPKTHHDYAGLYILNTVLGGYFGSRLMSELREARGLTYNVYSSVDTMQYGGYLYISAEVARGSEDEALGAIQLELEKLRTELIEEDELEMVRSYLMGAYLSMIDGPFNTAETVRALVSENCPLPHFKRLVDTTKSITAVELRRLAQRWLDTSNWTEVIVS